MVVAKWIESMKHYFSQASWRIEEKQKTLVEEDGKEISNTKAVIALSSSASSKKGFQKFSLIFLFLSLSIYKYSMLFWLIYVLYLVNFSFSGSSSLQSVSSITDCKHFNMYYILVLIWDEL